MLYCMAKTALSTGHMLAGGELLLLEIHQTSGQGMQWTPFCTNKGSKINILKRLPLLPGATLGLWFRQKRKGNEIQVRKLWCKDLNINTVPIFFFLKILVIINVWSKEIPMLIFTLVLIAIALETKLPVLFFWPLNTLEGWQQTKFFCVRPWKAGVVQPSEKLWSQHKNETSSFSVSTSLCWNGRASQSAGLGARKAGNENIRWKHSWGLGLVRCTSCSKRLQQH